MPKNCTVNQGQKYDQKRGNKMASVNDPNFDFFFSVFLGFSSWEKNFSARQMLFDCEYMKIIHVNCELCDICELQEL